jgi:C1A family cysteine protease
MPAKRATPSQPPPKKKAGAAKEKRRVFRAAAGTGEKKGVIPELRLGTGWLPEPPDERDYTASHPPLAALLGKLALTKLLRKRFLPSKADLTGWAGPVHFQGGFNTCNAHVVAGLVTYFEKKARGTDFAPSRLFLYKVAKNFLQQTASNAGVYVRQVMGVLKLIGVPPERYWPYPDPGTYEQPRSTDPLLDAEPTAFCYAIADDYQAISYYRLDEPDQKPEELLRLAKAHLALQVPFAFGFPIYELLKTAKTTGRIPYPTVPVNLANHAVVALGYDDDIVIGAGIEGATTTRGAIRIKNSWSEEWGEKGYGWLPYEFVLRGHTRDFWTLLRNEWVDTGAFQLIS